MLSRQALIFLIVGCCTVAVDYVCYQFFAMLGVNQNLAKGLSFLVGTVFAYYTNKAITFKYTGPDRKFRFLLIYASSLLLNVFTNAISLLLLPEITIATGLAFIIATVASATFNFLGMKYFAFK